MAEQKKQKIITIEIRSLAELKEFIETMTDGTLLSIDLKMVLDDE